MGVCADKSTRFLAERGYNVVRHPSVEYKPLILLGRQGGEVLALGPLDLLITNPPGPLPAVAMDQPAADLNGNTSDKLSIGVGLNILGGIISAMGGGNLGVNVNFTRSRKMQFTYSGVLNDSVAPLSVGNYLRDADVDAGNVVLREYVLGNGELFLITKIAKSNAFTVKFEGSNETAVEVDVPVIKEVAGGSIKVGASGEKNSVVTFEGPMKLAFAFQCFQVGVLDGNLALTSVRAGTIAAAVEEQRQSEPFLFNPGQMVGVRRN